MLDKIQKRLGAPDRISTVWFSLTAPPFHITYFYFVATSSKPHSNIRIVIMLLYCLNFYLLLKYAAYVEKKEKKH